jgi:GT2 family glycosyltransferase
MRAPGATAVDISIILVNWNALEHLRRALSTLREQAQGLDYEVIIVDNASQRDDSARVLAREFDWAKVILNDENRGFGAACNQGIHIARGRYVLLLNTDTVQIENAPAAAVRYMDAHPEVGVLGVRHLCDDAERSVQRSTFDFPNPFHHALAGLSLDNGFAERPHPEREADVDCVCGSFLMMRRECLEEVGGLDERYFVYEEDADWCLRAWSAGWRVRYWPGASIVHRGASAREFLADKSFMHLRSLLTYFRKNSGVAGVVAFYASMSLRLSAGSTRYGLKALLGQADPNEFSLRLKRQLSFMAARHSRRGIEGS